MSDIPNTRQAQILRWLQESHTLTIDELVKRLGVSTMTVHRDLDTLHRAGVVVKVHGGVTLHEAKAERAPAACHLCDSPETRTAFTIQTESGEQYTTCCPHCGFLLLNDMKQTPAALLTKDFLYGRTLNARQGIFVLESVVTLCCVPSALCFASLEDARRFQQGFSGQTMNFNEAWQYLVACHLR